MKIDIHSAGLPQTKLVLSENHLLFFLFMTLLKCQNSEIPHIFYMLQAALEIVWAFSAVSKSLRAILSSVFSFLSRF